MRTRYMPRQAMGQPLILDDKGRLWGGQIAPRSIPGDRVGVSALSQITDRLGVVRYGTIYCGGGAGEGEVVIGSDAYGIRSYDQQARRLWLSFDYRDMSGRLGLVGTPGVDITTGLVHMHGDAIVDGTLTAGKINVGSLATQLLTADEIRVGTGTWNTDFTGTRISLAEGIEGYAKQTRTLHLNPETGHLESFNWTTDINDYSFIDIGGGRIRIENRFERGDSYLELLSTYMSLPTDENPDGVETESVVAAYLGRDDLIFRLLSSSNPRNTPTIRLAAYDPESGAEAIFGQNILRLIHPWTYTTFMAQALADYAVLSSAGYKMRFGAEYIDAGAYMEVFPNETGKIGSTFRIAKGLLSFGPNESGIWVDQPSEPTYRADEFVIWPDYENDQLHVYLPKAKKWAHIDMTDD